MKELFHKQRLALDYFFSHLDEGEAERFFAALADCEGVIFFTGVGKSGFIAQKIAATMMSTGTKSLYLSPIDALHGDIGMVSAKDSLVILSKSGETEELLHLVPQVRNRGAKIFALISYRNSSLAKASDFFVVLPCLNELCPFDLAPTTSSEVQLLFGDALACALMQKKGITLKEYAENHPGGKIGKQTALQVKDLMLDIEKTPLCFAQETLASTLPNFSEKQCGCLIVVDEERRLKGIFTDGDLRRALQNKGERILKENLSVLMSQKPRSISHQALAWEALKLMESDKKRPITVLPVTENDKVIGLIKMHDILQAGL